MSTDTVLFDVAEGVATITLNRPDRLNAFTAEMHQGLRDAFGRATRDATVRAVILTGAGRAFSAGQDLKERGFDASADGSEPNLGESFRDHYNPLIRTIRRLEIPVIAAVNGVAAGAGANVALACDIVIAGRGASFIQAFSRIGLIPDAAGTFYLPRLIGRARAMGLAMLGEAVGGEQAETWGLIWKCVDDDRLMDEATAMARALAAGPTKALGLIKEALNASETNSMGEQLELERLLQQAAGRTQDYLEGVAAFLEASAPVQGRLTAPQKINPRAPPGERGPVSRVEEARGGVPLGGAEAVRR